MPSTTSWMSCFLDEAHLDVDLGVLGLPVGAQILVAERPRDLVVALEAADHQQLLEQLRRLRQGVELARLQPAGHEEVAGALRRALGEDGRLDVDEALVAQVAAHRLDDLVAQQQVVEHARAGAGRCSDT